MKPRTQVVLLATLMTATGWGQEVSLYGTTMAQMWKAEVPGFDKATYAPATQYLGIDATKLGAEKLSLHLFGWGQTDLRTQMEPESKSRGYLSTGYLQYQFEHANAELKAGRFLVNQGAGIEQVDGVSVRTDLVNGFTFSAFGGVPVLYKTVDPTSRKDYEFQRDVIFGARLGWRMGKVGEVGLSYLQDGSKAAQDLKTPYTADYTRKQLGADIQVAPTTVFAFRGRTVFDVANERTNIAEHDYTATMKVGSQVVVSGNYAERNFLYYFAGTNLPSLFRQDENDLFKGWGGSVTWNTPWSMQVVADYRHMQRASYGDSNRVGGEIRWSNGEKTFQAGAGGHFVNAEKALLVDAAAPYRSLKHAEARAWAMVSKGKLSASLDGILQKYSKANPYLNGLTNVYEVVGSLGYQATKSVKVSGDVSYGSTPVAKGETRGLLRAEYRFGMKGGK